MTSDGDWQIGANGLVVNAPTTVKNSTFSVAGTGVGIAVAANVTVSGSTFTGVSGVGLALDLNGGTASVVGTSTFTGLSEALDVTAPAAVSFGGNTVDKCGIATTGPDTIMVNSTAGNGVLVYNNKITNSLGYIINVAANDNLVFVMGNNFSGNTKNAKDAANAVVGTALNVTHNYWGGTNPASVTTAPLISYDNPLGGAPTTGTVAAGTTVDASATAGVKITASTGSIVVGAVALAANPLGTSIVLPTTVTAKNYYDVFGVGTTTATIRFLGTTAKPIASTDMVYFYNATFGRWDPATIAANNPFGNYIDVSAGAITGTPFALVSVIPTQAPPPADVTPQYPRNGATDIPVDCTFSWAAVAGATGYQFAIAQDNPDLTNKFAVLDYSANTPTNAEKLQETLLYYTTYWWEVRAVSGTAASPIYSPWSVVSFFTTEQKPVATTTTTPPPPVTVTQTQIVVTNPPATTITFTNPPVEKTQPIPSYLLWAVIAVGAVLVIAVIVLIVRTRRMP